MNLTIVSPYPPDITGIGQYGFHVSQSLVQSGQFTKINVLAGARSIPDRADRPPGITVRYIWKPGGYRSGPAILAELRRQKPDLVWFNMGASIFGKSPLANLMGFFSMYQVWLSKVPTVVTMHELVELADLKTLRAPGGRLALVGARFLTHLAARSDVVCLTMRRYVDWFSTHYPQRTCVHIPIGAYQAPERLAESPEDELLFFTTLAPYKGLEVLLIAYVSLLSYFPHLRLTIAGVEHPRFPGYRQTLLRRYTHLPGINWLGTVPEAEIRQLFARSQIVILPYLASTGSSSVLYQAAMWGRPLVVSDLPELKATAEESNLAVTLFKTRDAASLAEAIRSLLDSPARRQAQLDHNFDSIQRRRPEVTCQAYLQAFNRALEARRSPKRIGVPTQTPWESVG